MYSTVAAADKIRKREQSTSEAFAEYYGSNCRASNIQLGGFMLLFDAVNEQKSTSSRPAECILGCLLCAMLSTRVK